MMDWISVEDRFPEIGDKILFYDVENGYVRDGARVCARHGRRIIEAYQYMLPGGDSIFVKSSCVTHWKPTQDESK